MEVFRRLKHYYMPHIKWFILSVVTLVLVTALGLVYPKLLQFLIDDIVIAGKYEWLPYASLAVLLAAGLRALFRFYHQYTGHLFGIDSVYDLRMGLYNKLQSLSFTYFDNAKTGDLMARLTGDVEAFRMFLSFGVVQLLNIVLMLSFGLVMMASINVELTVVTFIVTIPLLAFVSLRFDKQAFSGFMRIRRAIAKMTTRAQENITGVRTVKSFSRESHEIERFADTNEQYLQTYLKTADVWAKYFPIMETIANLSIVLLLGYGGFLVIQGRMSPGDLAAFFTLIWYIIGPIWSLGFQLNNLTQARAAGERLLEIFDAEQHVQEKTDARELPQIKGHVTFDNVTFNYDGTELPALTDINIDAKPNSVIALLGATGSGKTSVVQLLMRSYDVSEGKVTIDGYDVRDVTLKSLREQIGIVFQETFLFSARIRDNIAYGNPAATEEQIVRAAKIAQAHDFITEMPDGYETVVGERGMGLSGGQKQRIAIARSILTDPRILILDDATSAVDMETEMAIQSSLRSVMKGRTTFVIAHRISTLKSADEIIVLDAGRIVQRGTHDELVKQPGAYRRVFDVQFKDQLDVMREMERMQA
ncbi:ABC transporter ATP-binding protein [Numidum massiliense]|uniref:ABC transporter ATP-binding protein n=1 Tax=Numidum massiliense TaxID=1522315 RepID=UPI0006D55E20|nr:ABC transporter ATP-binding protein [Numidum massiliense]